MDKAEAATAAAQYNIPIPPTPEVWQAVLAQSKDKGWKSRQALLMLAATWGDSFLAQAFDAYAERTDPYTETVLLQLMIDKMPQDPRTPRYALSLVKRLHGAKWPDNLDLHGVQPFGSVRGDLLPQIWSIPQEVAADELDTAVLAWAEQASNSRGAWSYENSSNRWTLPRR